MYSIDMLNARLNLGLLNNSKKTIADSSKILLSTPEYCYKAIEVKDHKFRAPMITSYLIVHNIEPYYSIIKKRIFSDELLGREYAINDLSFLNLLFKYSNSFSYDEERYLVSEARNSAGSIYTNVESNNKFYHGYFPNDLRLQILTSDNIGEYFKKDNIYDFYSSDSSYDKVMNYYHDEISNMIDDPNKEDFTNYNLEKLYKIVGSRESAYLILNKINSYNYLNQIRPTSAEIRKHIKRVK